MTRRAFRALLSTLVLGLGLGTASPAAAEPTTFVAPVACGVGCAYWVNQCVGCANDGNWGRTRDALEKGGDVSVCTTPDEDVPIDVIEEVCTPPQHIDAVLEEGTLPRQLLNTKTTVEECDKPFPEGSYDQRMLETGHQGVDVKISPTVDWDGFVCAYRNPTQDELDLDPYDTQPRWRAELELANDFTGGCPNPTGIPEVAVGCIESGGIDFAAGIQYKLLAYNWSDAPIAPGEITYR